MQHGDSESTYGSSGGQPPRDTVPARLGDYLVDRRELTREQLDDVPKQRTTHLCSTLKPASCGLSPARGDQGLL